MEAKKRKRVGIMGGTFDPIHIGHLILGEHAYQQYVLDTVLYMPAGNPPHKKNRRGRATKEERIAMVERAIRENPHFELSLAEAHDKGYSYTKDTLSKLKEQNPDTDYYFIIGADSLFAFETWEKPSEICRLCILVVAIRDHVNDRDLEKQQEYLKKKYNADIRNLDTPNIDVSSRNIRNLVALKKSLRYFVPEEVVSYIEENKLYEECEEDGQI